VSVPLHIGEEISEELARGLKYKTGTFPLKYLGLPIHWKKLRILDGEELIEK
jgi:hypothetical protein